ncbi:hypothetical protein AB0M34_24685 [Nocardia sp. NPDC050193]
MDACALGGEAEEGSTGPRGQDEEQADALDQSPHPETASVVLPPTAGPGQ